MNTGLNILVDVLGQCGLNESRLKDLGRNLRGASMSTTRRIMAMGNNTLPLFFEERELKYPILITLKMKRFLLYIDVMSQKSFFS